MLHPERTSELGRDTKLCSQVHQKREGLSLLNFELSQNFSKQKQSKNSQGHFDGHKVVERLLSIV